MGRGWLLLRSSSLSDQNSRCAPLPAHPPARIPPHSPPVQERRPAPVCHPLCEGGPPGLGSGSLVRAAPSGPGPLSTSGGQDRGCSQPLAQSWQPRTALSSNLLSVLLPLGSPGAGPVPGAVLNSVRNDTAARSVLQPGPRLRVFIKIIRLSTVVSLPGHRKNPCKACVRVGVPQSTGAPAPHSPPSHWSKGGHLSPGQEGPARNKPLNGGGYGGLSLWNVTANPSNPRGPLSQRRTC